tara:strand:+ start:3200 stop:4357 length:1158 start_codon:yes stop_codon:yes gene_type:complete
MGDQQSMFAILAAFYALECLMWLPRGSVVFSAWFQHFARRAPGEFLGNFRGAMVVRPIFPFGSVFQVMPMPIAISPTGIAFSPVTPVNPEEVIISNGEFLQWKDINNIRSRGKAVQINNIDRWKAPSPTIAVAMAAQLNTLLSAPEEARDDVIQQQMAESFDAKAIGQRADEAQSKGRTLAVLGTILFVFVNCALLPMAFSLAFTDVWIWIIGATLLQTTSITILFWRAHKQLYPHSGDERFTAGLTMLLFAPAAMRAKDLITAPALTGFHPLPTAAHLSPRTVKSYARFILRELKWAPSPQTSSESASTIRWHKEELSLAIIRCCTGQGWDPVDLAKPPPPADPESRSYCPRCLSEFVTETGNCSPCGNVKLQPLVIDAPNQST